MVHANTFTPVPNALTAVVGESELVIVPLPETMVHAPVPMAGILAAIFVLGDEAQSV